MAIRIGFVNSFNEAEGTATVNYPDRGNEVTGDLLVFSPLGLPQHLAVGEMVLVLHLDSGSEEGSCLAVSPELSQGHLLRFPAAD